MFDISHAEACNHYSEHGEDGVLQYIFDHLAPYIHTTPRTFVRITDTYRQKNMFTHLVKNLGFKGNVHVAFHDGKIPCTIQGVLDYITEPRFHRYPFVDLLSIDATGVDFWLLKTYISHCSDAQKPRVIVVRINYIIDNTRAICVPYVPPENRARMFNTHYFGASLKAYVQLLAPYGYTFVGTVKYGIVGFFVRNTPPIEFAPIDTDTYLDSFPNVTYAKAIRWPQVNNKFWINVS